ncbi:MAG: dual specificity protein phosphatase family protein [Planctomycetes bacterium]|nr:dual specificity protein phosphatase family protein [Planctomycetota bacterium]
MKTTRQAVLRILPVLVVGVGLVLLGLAASDERDFNYSLIEKGFYMGGDVTKPPPGTNAVLNLCKKKDLYLCETHVWEPIRDAAPAPDLDWLRRQVEFIEARRKAGDTVYVHCRNGVSRSGMVVVAYEMSKNRWTRDAALQFVRSKRPVTRPNPAFLKRLLEWERMVLKRPGEEG